MSFRDKKLFLLFLMLFGLALSVHRPWEGSAHTQTSATVFAMFPGLNEDSNQIAMIEIVSPSGMVTLQRGQQGKRDYPWKVVQRFGHPADLTRLRHLLDSMAALTTADLVSEEKSSHETYQVEKSRATRVRVLNAQGVILADLVGGGLRSQDPTSGRDAVLEFYIRPTASSAVYLAGNYSAPLTSPDDWCDTWFLRDLETARIQTLEREDLDGTESWKLVRTLTEDSSQSIWQMVAPVSREVPAFVGDSFAYSVVHFRAAEVIGASIEDPRLGQITDIFRVGIDDDVLEMVFGAPAGENRRYGIVRGLPFLYAVAQHDVEQLRQSVRKMQVLDED